MKLGFSRHIFKNPQISIFMIIHAVGEEFFLADRGTKGQTGRHNESNGRFSQFRETNR